MNVPDRSDFVILDFDPQAGHEQMKRRSALVLSPVDFNRIIGWAFVAPVTTKPRGHAFEIALPPGSKVKGAVMVHHLKSLDWRARRARVAGKAPAAVVEEAVDIVSEILG
jgi:mRNA interferase MazF